MAALLHRVDPAGVTPILLGVVTPAGVDLGAVHLRLHAAGWNAAQPPTVARVHATGWHADFPTGQARIHQAGPVEAVPA